MHLKSVTRTEKAEGREQQQGQCKRSVITAIHVRQLKGRLSVQSSLNTGPHRFFAFPKEHLVYWILATALKLGVGNHAHFFSFEVFLQHMSVTENVVRISVSGSSALISLLNDFMQQPRVTSRSNQPTRTVISNCSVLTEAKSASTSF